MNSSLLSTTDSGDFSFALSQETECCDKQQHIMSADNSFVFSLWSLWKRNFSYESYGSIEINSDLESESKEHAIKGKSEQKRSVRFSHVEIREHAVTLGDHSSKLYPVTLDWTHTETETIDINEHIRNRIMNSIQRGNENPKKSSGTKAFRLRTAERFKRLAIVTGIEVVELFNMEKDRHEKMIQEEKNRVEDDDDDEEA